MPDEGRSPNREFMKRKDLKTGEDFQKWLDSNPGGGKTDWDRKKGIF